MYNFERLLPLTSFLLHLSGFCSRSGWTSLKACYRYLPHYGGYIALGLYTKAVHILILARYVTMLEIFNRLIPYECDPQQRVTYVYDGYQSRSSLWASNKCRRQPMPGEAVYSQLHMPAS